MRTLFQARMLSIGAGCLLLAGCGGFHGSQSSIPSAGLAPATHSLGASYTILHRFGGPGDGGYPMASLIAIGNTLYGTTQFGGGSTACASGCGAVFSVQLDGAERIVYGFKGSPDGEDPTANLTEMNGTLYGTTYLGGRLACPNSPSGRSPCGTVFELSTSGTERVLYAFKNVPDADVPAYGLVEMSGALWSSSLGGGTSDGGTVFEITTAGQERVMHSFPSGVSPNAIVAASGALYGTTFDGGTHHQGAVFEVKSTGEEQLLYSFKGNSSSDGAFPNARLVYLNGTLYGTTQEGGGASKACQYGCGAVFAIDRARQERVIYRFNGIGGANPQAGLIAYNGTLYGTTTRGGTAGRGTVFALSTSGTEQVLHSFLGGSDGADPTAELLAWNGELFGTTQLGGRTCSCGTVFEISP